jgi:hypothetical protein
MTPCHKAVSIRIEIRLSWAKVAAALEGASQRPDLDPVVVSIEAKLRRAGKGKRLVIENGARAEVNAGLAAMIAEAFALRNYLLAGSDDSIEAMSGRLGMNKCRLTSLIRRKLITQLRGILLRCNCNWKRWPRQLAASLKARRRCQATLKVAELVNIGTLSAFVIICLAVIVLRRTRSPSSPGYP